VRAGDLGVAIRYARAHLAQWAEAYEAEHQRACALLAFSGATGCSRYAGLLDDSRWAALVRLFHGDLFRLHNMPPVSLLNVHLQVCVLPVLCQCAHLTCSATISPVHSRLVSAAMLYCALLCTVIGVCESVSEATAHRQCVHWRDSLSVHAPTHACTLSRS